MSGGAVHGKRRRTSAAPTHGAGRQTIPPFLTALWDMVDSPENVNLISWSQEGRSFVVHDPNGLEELLPQYFKHNRFTSFIRQLNMYQFTRIVTDNCKWEWMHEGFRRDAPELLQSIHRKPPASDHKAHVQGNPLATPIRPQIMETECNPTLEQRVADLEDHRVDLLSELRFEKLTQKAMQNQIKLLEAQVEAIGNILFKNKTPMYPDAHQPYKLQQLLLEDRIRRSPLSGHVSEPQTPQTPLTPMSQGDDVSKFIVVEPENNANTALSKPGTTNGCNSDLNPRDAAMLDLDFGHLNFDQTPFPNSPLMPESFPDTPGSIPRALLPPASPSDNPFTQTTINGRTIRTIHVEDSDGRAVAKAQVAMQKLLEEMNEAYKGQGYGGSILPPSYDGFGCWFVNGKPSSSSAEPNGDRNRKPWAVLFYGLSS
ncbi:HSF-type DNA-binding domain-containing protein [Plasmodiophora brassicae]|uniref:HSF-type DNA-binding domain-containing protein n=1 Tax=Plasmodiophora brassicae TaxID=37360 RepID=A0A0G4J1W9_PLABS|nr:hypothetical protein PBRA_001887 [Plasmodiophora brassicae]